MSQQVRRLVALALATSAGLFASALVFLSGRPDALEPPENGHTLIGVQMDWSADNPRAYVERTGTYPAQYGDFMDYPLTEKTTAMLISRAKEAGQQRGNFFITLMPQGGLETVTEDNARTMALTLATINNSGVHFYVRFGHEMNGSWYAWCQQPDAYIKAFRIIANAVHKYAPGNAVVWSPNIGSGGYPFPDWEFSAKPGTADFSALDTDRDGQLTIDDDPYAPYYPGDEYVDWVGLTIYWWGFKYPWGDNEIPDHRFVSLIRGTYRGTYDDERALPDFYEAYAAAKNKPMAISETAALYNVAPPDGPFDQDIKRAWVDQVFAPTNADEFPLLKMINWFEHKKPEKGTRGIIDWRITGEPDQLALYRKAVVSQARFEFAPGRWEIQWR